METQCITFYQFGSPLDVLTVEHKLIQAPAEGEVLVRMIMRPINPSDLLPIRGAYAQRISLPTVPGYEGVGIIEEVGPSVSPTLIGQRVLPLRGEGTWQELVKTSVAFAMPIPDSLEDYVAAQLYINPLTAWVICTEVLALKADDVLLVNACGSSIGRIFIQLAKLLGFKLIAVTRNNLYSEELLKLGAAYVINATDVNIKRAVMDITDGQGAHAAIDSVGGVAGTELAYCLQVNGTLLSIGLLSGMPINWEELARRTRVNVKLFHLRHWNQRVSVSTWQETFTKLITLFKDHKLSLLKPNSYFKLEDVKEAIGKLESISHLRGKIFLTG